MSRRPTPTQSRLTYRAVIEVLETRRLLSAGTLRIVSYNIDADTSDFSQNDQLSGLGTIFKGIGTIHLNDNGTSNAQAPDVIALQELNTGTAQNPPTLSSITARLNTVFSGVASYAYDTTNDPTTGGTGGGPNGLIYNTQTIQDLGASILSPASGSGAPRAPIQYKLQPVGFDSSAIFYIDVSHFKSGAGDNARRQVEAQAIVDNLSTPAISGKHVLSVGDFNFFDNSAEQGYQTILRGFNDYEVPSGSWNDASISSSLLTESATNVRYRDDIEFITPNGNPASGVATSGLQYDPGSFLVFGNGGIRNTSVTSGSNSNALTDPALASTRSAILSALTTTTDHLPVVGDYTIVSSTSLPQIGSFTINPSSAVSGSNVTLSANNVIANSGTISNVKFYRETNGTANLQIGFDTLIGTGTQSGSTYTITLSTTGYFAGSSTFYAVATDSNGGQAIASQNLTVTSQPSIASLTINPNTVASGGTVTLSANTVTDAGSSVNQVRFYRDSDGVAGLQTATDTFVGLGTQSGITWTLNNVSTTNLNAGVYAYYAVASDPTNATSVPVSNTLTVTANAPTIGSLTASPASIPVNSGAPTSLIASSVDEVGGSVTSVAYYRESNGTAGLQTGTGGDVVVTGNLSQSGNTWTLSNVSTAGLAVGAYTFYAVATDGVNQVSSAAASTTFSVVPPSQPLVNLKILGSTSINGTYSSTLNVLPGQTYYFEIVGQLAPIGTSNGNGKTINSLASTDGINSLKFNILDDSSNIVPVSFISAALSSPDGWSGGSGAAPGTITSQGSGSNNELLAIRPAQLSGVNAGASTQSLIETGSFTTSSTAVTGTSQIIGNFNGSGSFKINNGTSVFITTSTETGQYPLVGYAPLSITEQPAGLPAWLAAGSQATFNSTTKVLDVTGTATIIADPGSDLPVSTVETGATLNVLPTNTNEFIHLGGLTVLGTGKLDVKSVSSRSHSHHDVLVVGTVAGSAPTFSIASTAKIDLEDNDLIVHHGSLTTVSDKAFQGRNGTTGGFLDGTWDGNGLTSSAAHAQAISQGQEYTALAVVENAALPLGQFSTWQVGSQSENLALNGDDVIVKYTYVGDWTLNGQVGDDAETVFGSFFGTSAASIASQSGNNFWAYGSYNRGGLDDDAQSVFGAYFGQGNGVLGAQL